jgi:5-methylcytosine-specific restriction endonuclease McrA
MSQKHDDQRESSAKRGYGYKWQKAREGFLKSHPLCAMHLDLGQYVPATLVDHIDPHKGDQTKFWNRANWQSLCKDCHDGAKQRLEKTGVLTGCSLDGFPVDPNHHWSRKS